MKLKLNLKQLLIIPFFCFSCKSPKILVKFRGIDDIVVSKMGDNQISYCLMWQECDTTMLFFDYKNTNKVKTSIYKISKTSNRFLRINNQNIPLITKYDVSNNWNYMRKGVSVSFPTGYAFVVKMFCPNRDSCFIVK